MMTLGEKLQRLRKGSGLSQEELAGQLTVSRQAVSKWELDESMPDTDNVVQLARLFGVSCDYLLRDEVNEGRGVQAPLATAQAKAPGETHLDEKGWVRNATTLSLAMCAIGLVVAYMCRIGGHTVRPLAAGLAIQVLGLALFELAVPRMGDSRKTARLDFYGIACWLVPPIPVLLALGWISELRGWTGSPLRVLTYYFALDLLLSAAVTVALAIFRHKARKIPNFGQNNG